jgi:peptide chain release factor 3
VLLARLEAEYGLPIGFDATRFTLCRWITSSDPIALKAFSESHASAMASDLDGDPVFMAPSPFSLKYDVERYPAITFSDVKDYQRAVV